jgi:hypothetical protein
MADMIVYATYFDRLKALIKWYNLSTNVAVRQQIIKTVKSWLEEVAVAIKLTDITDYEETWYQLALAMTKDAETILARAVIVNTSDVLATSIIKPRATPANVGTGKLTYSLLSEVPFTSLETAPFEVLRIRCVDASVSCKERFTIEGGAVQSEGALLATGSGGPTTLVCAGTTLRNANFATWTGSPAALSDWTLAAGVWGTGIAQEATAHRSLYSVGFTMNVASQLTQALPSNPKPFETWALGFWARYKTNACTGNLVISVIDADSNVIATTTFNTATLTNAFVFYPVFFEITGAVHGACTFSIANAGGGNAEVALLDLPQFVKMTTHGGIRFALFAGATDWAVDDSFGQASDSLGVKVEVGATAGVIQTFLAQSFSIQLPSAASGETIADP